MSLEKRINGFVKLGLFLKQFKTNNKDESLNKINDQFYHEFEDLILRQKSYNGWFDKENVASLSLLEKTVEKGRGKDMAGHRFEVIVSGSLSTI